MPLFDNGDIEVVDASASRGSRVAVSVTNAKGRVTRQKLYASEVRELRDALTEWLERYAR